MTKPVLTWAREQMGYSLDELASAIGKAPEVLTAWEEVDDERYPTFRQLEQLANVLKRPVAVFFFPTPPSEAVPTEEFRMLPTADAASGAPDTRYAIRDAHAKQLRLLELLKGQNHAARDFLFTSDDKLTPSKVRKLLGISVEAQRCWKSTDEALKTWRKALEARGIYIFKRSFKQKAVSGFCLWHPIAPVIVINNGTTFNRQIFTLFHELAHLLHKHNGVTRADPEYLESLEPAEMKIEVACNKFAADFLVPPSSFKPLIAAYTGSEDQISDWAIEFRVSREVILRRLFDAGKVSGPRYSAWVQEWTQDYYQRSGDGSGGNYYRTQATYLSDTYVKLAFSSYYAGESSMAQLADTLNIKAKNIATFEDKIG